MIVQGEQGLRVHMQGADASPGNDCLKDVNALLKFNVESVFMQSLLGFKFLLCANCLRLSTIIYRKYKVKVVTLCMVGIDLMLV